MSSDKMTNSNKFVITTWGHQFESDIRHLDNEVNGLAQLVEHKSTNKIVI